MKDKKAIRLKKYDYKGNGYYFVTIVTKLRLPLLKDKEREVEKQLLDLVARVQGLNLDYWTVMVNRIHLILVLDNCKIPLGEIVRRFKAKVSHKFSQPFWQANYYEHVIRNEYALNKIREYTLNNPQAEVLKFEQFYK